MPWLNISLKSKGNCNSRKKDHIIHIPFAGLGCYKQQEGCTNAVPLVMASFSSTSDCSWPNSWWLQHVLVQTLGNVIFPAALCWSRSLLSWLNKKTLNALWRSPWGWLALNLCTSYLLAWPRMLSSSFTKIHWSLAIRSSWVPRPAVSMYSCLYHKQWSKKAVSPVILHYQILL